MNTKNFIISFVIVFLLMLLLQAPFNMFIDPYNTLSYGKLSGINEATREFSRRTTVPYQSENLGGNSLTLGSSRALPLDAWKYYPPEANIHWNNLWINMGNINEVRRILQQAVAFNEVKIAIIGLDFEGFNAHNIRTGPFETMAYALTQEGKSNFWQIFSQLELCFSPVTTRASLLTLADNLGCAKFFNFVPDVSATTNAVPSRASIKLTILEGMKKAVRDFAFEDMERGVSSLKDIRAIVQTCQQKGVKLLLFVNPEHASSLEAYHQLGCWASYQEWLRQLATIVADCNTQAPGHSVKLWCFAGYSDVNASYLGADTEWRNNYFGDIFHFSPMVAQFILDRLTGRNLSPVSAPENFGTLLTPENVEQVLQTMDVERAKYLENAKAWK